MLTCAVLTRKILVFACTSLGLELALPALEQVSGITPWHKPKLIGKPTYPHIANAWQNVDVTLAEGSYTKEQLITAINQQLVASHLGSMQKKAL